MRGEARGEEDGEGGLEITFLLFTLAWLIFLIRDSHSSPFCLAGIEAVVRAHSPGFYGEECTFLI